MRAGEQHAVLLGDDHEAVRPFDVVAQHFGIDALPVEHVRFGGPALPAGVAAIGGGHQRDQGIDVGGGRGAELQVVHGYPNRVHPNMYLR